MPFCRAWGGWRWQLWVPVAARQPRAQPRAPGRWLEAWTRPRCWAPSSSRGIFWRFTGSCRGLCFRMRRIKLCKTTSNCAKPPRCDVHLCWGMLWISLITFPSLLFFACGNPFPLGGLSAMPLCIANCCTFRWREDPQPGGV